ncbi:DUF3768 domain-containing protein [Sphingobium sp. AS12]|uniref:DUF3768 domain-containing protein n=1 Tax=Sphingobium sp. AS12 TaxID=2849495 RepID=UPI000CC256CA|nr:DUF3768 domain-containing protein [Sphingobium sp. AS12]MBV2149899.1 DUF3768 domain-containing protein [Sphingobium sp. AS12]PKP94725.1 MAG: hypothetical protein CVT77_01585 [Alphaproteobacteria bacterium HGW-Alphaproteobacteria-16]
MASTNAIPRTEKIARLNDNARWHYDPTTRHVVTATCLATLAPDNTQLQLIWARAKLQKALREATFTKESPERDRAEIYVDGHRLHFKIDYYDPALEFGSEDPANASITVRVITIMLYGED